MIFGYGTLITLNYKKFPLVAEVDGFKRIYHDSEIYHYHFPFAIKRDGLKMRGIILLEDDNALDFYDNYEGYPSFYDRVEVPFRIISDSNGLLEKSDVDELKAWIYVPSNSTESLRLDRIYKIMRREDKVAYDEMMKKDMWLEKLRRDHPYLLDVLPALFEKQV
ncbi:MAG: gamma-glutamylcyclotransferase family protein [Promethearchaeota archaeon]